MGDTAQDIVELQKKGLVAAVGQTSAPAFRCYHCQRDGHYANRCPDRNLELSESLVPLFNNSRHQNHFLEIVLKNNPGAEKQGADLEAHLYNSCSRLKN